MIAQWVAHQVVRAGEIREYWRIDYCCMVLQERVNVRIYRINFIHRCPLIEGQAVDMLLLSWCVNTLIFILHYLDRWIQEELLRSR